MGGVDTVLILPSSSGGRVVPSGDMRPSEDADVSSEWAVLRVVILSRRVYCCFGSFSPLLIKGDGFNVIGCYFS